ncbi:MAG TPA: hypothetical protein VIY29_31415, partial [Ktedonobacteraceae bacterium]
MPYISEEGKLTLREIKRRHRLSTDAVAAIAGVEASLVYTMEQGGVLARKDVDRILGRLAELTGQDYSVETAGGFW